MGEVYSARDTHSDQIVATKVFLRMLLIGGGMGEVYQARDTKLGPTQRSILLRPVKESEL